MTDRARLQIVPALLAACLALLLALTLFAAYSLGSGGRSQAAVLAPAAASEATARTYGTITMTGTGEATGVPDQLSFTLSISRKADDVATAMDQATATMRRALGALAAKGVLRKDTRSTGLSIDPEYDYPSYGPPVLTGYRVRQTVSVLVRDLRDGGRAIAAAVRAGGNATRVSGIGLRIGDKDALLADAREAAVRAATAKAQQYADATGQPLGRVLTVKEGSVAARVPQPQLLTRAMGYLPTADTAALEALPIRAGRSDLSVRVTVVWALDGGE
ncbi:SIMPL domain-containing protein [Nocardioides marmoribigeumensis]|uniref:Uncharacterized protein YggE n=1 Tax=Nocardioides marmoribigeumensis TaxID=433649 RepID=A0ABU2BZY7_9ACTN|nr:SIMPL domain-containing protein [Nocardioides marmoribigeumensis]MDR7363971.1 uncharacterized protein YggE [Nocardioides marmoribigeumensis]